MNNRIILSFAFMVHITCLFGQPSDYVAHYPLDRNVYDYSGNEHHGSNNGTTHTLDRFENEASARLFDGGNDYVDLGATAGSELRTISLWFQTDELIDENLSDFISLIVRNNGEASIQPYEFAIAFAPTTENNSSPGKLRFSMEDDSGNLYEVYSDTDTWETSNWHHVAAVVDESEGMKLFVDGVEQGDSNSYAASTGTITTITVLGKWGDLDTRFFKGKMDDIKLYDYALSAAEVTELYEAEAEIFAPVISSISPTSGPVGTEVTIEGRNFNPGEGSNVVYFGAALAHVTEATSRSIKALVPDGATYHPVTVETSDLLGYSSQSFTITFEGDEIGSTSFLSSQTYSTGAPSFVTSADFNQDGRIDLLVANRTENTVSILQNTSGSSISFDGKTNLIVSNDPNSLAVGDLDGDDRIDVAVANRTNNTVSVYRNESTDDISFEKKTELTANGSPISAAIRDLNVDGQLDIIAANEIGNSISLFKNTYNVNADDGEVSFDTKVDLSCDEPVAVAVEDLNGDGLAEIVAVGESSGIISIYKNNSPAGGDFSFDSPLEIAINENPVSLALADLNDDQKIDLVVTTIGDSKITIFENTTEAGMAISFEEQIKYATGDNPSSVSIGDLNGDSKPDLVVTDTGDNSVSAFKNLTEGNSWSFDTKVSFAASTSPVSCFIGSLNNDGKPDLIIANQGSTSITVLKNSVAVVVSNTATDFLTFGFAEQVGATVIDHENHTISIKVAEGTDLTTLTATFTQSEGATVRVDGSSQSSGVTVNDFSYQIDYRVIAQDGSELQIWSVNVSVVNHPTITNITSAVSYVIGSGGYAISATVTDDTDVDKVVVYHMPSSGTSFNSSEMNFNGEKYTYGFGDLDFDDLGLTFYLKATDESGNETISLRHSAKTIRNGDVEAIPNLISSTDQLDYSIIALPHEAQAVASAFSNLGGFDENEWRLAHYGGETDYGYYPGYFINFEPGKGYWFLTSRPVDFKIQGGTAVQADISQSFVMELRAEDWNMIGNPYPFDIDWQEVIDHNAGNDIAVDKLVTYKDRQYNSDQTELHEYDGALLYASSAVEIEIPVSARSNSGSRKSKAKRTNHLEHFGSGPWEFALNLRNESMQFDVSGIGMNEKAQKGMDSYDWKMLPRLSNFLDISFPGAVTKSVVPVSDHHTWEFSVNSNLLGENATLSWDNAGLKDADYSLVLLDMKNQQVVDMSQGSYYSFEIQDEKHPFRLFYAHRDRLPTYVSSTTSFVGEPFPNPSNGVIVLPFVLDELNSIVGIKVFDILGREVSAYSQEMTPGYSEIEIDLSEKVSHLKAGTYLLQVSLQGEQAVKRVNKRIIYNR